MSCDIRHPDGSRTDVTAICALRAAGDHSRMSRQSAGRAVSACLGGPSGVGGGWMVEQHDGRGSRHRTLGIGGRLCGAPRPRSFAFSAGGRSDRCRGGRRPQAPAPMPASTRSPCCRSRICPAIAAQNFFADGMTDALITDLARINDLDVISRTSAMLYRNSPKRCPRLRASCQSTPSSRDRSCATAIASAYRRSSSTLRPIGTCGPRVRARDVQDVLALQREVARDIAREVRLSCRRKKRPDSRPGRALILWRTISI